ncbi:MAG: hypothetical protein H6540_04590 [Bacteroidales bacterium]|nr:hypothetical protein [Bacteroidales bacterium]
MGNQSNLTFNYTKTLEQIYITIDSKNIQAIHNKAIIQIHY